MTGHFNEKQKLIVKGIRSDSFAEHYSRILPKNIKPSPQELRALMDFKVLQKMNPISTMKTIGTDHCKLCTDEKIKILKYTRELGPLIINKCSEVYGACRHRTKFHWFSSDEATEVAERANYPDPQYNYKQV